MPTDEPTPQGIAYRLPTGEVIRVFYSVCRGRLIVSYTMQGGIVVDAVREPGQDDQITAAYHAWKHR